MKLNARKVLHTAVCASLLGSVAMPSQAANWLMLQGTEPSDTAKRAHLWGFIQPEYQSTSGSKLTVGGWKGNYNVLNAIVPDATSNKQFNIRRARVGVRGVGLPLDSNVNYFFLAEFGNNGVTKPGGGTGSAKMTDASITLNHIKGARVRVGLFKTPTGEEGLQAIHTFDYINFTNVGDQALLERFVKYDGSGTVASGTAQSDNGVNKPVSGVGAFRDTGIQVFDAFTSGDWETSYAVMVGNGNGSVYGDNNDSMDSYVYLSTEKVYGGKGPRRNGWKFFAWQHSGTRTITDENGTAAVDNDETVDVDRKRSGFGTSFRKGKYRAGFEYVKASGLLRNGTDGGAPVGAVNSNDILAGLNYELDGEADGWYLDFGYKFTPKWEVDVRYDIYNRMTNSTSKERTFETTTLGLQYFLNKKSRFVVNYELRDAEAPGFSSTANQNKIFDSLDDRFSAELLVIF